MWRAFRSVLVAFARYRPSQPPELRVTRLHLRSLYVTTWRFAHMPFACDVRGLRHVAFTSWRLSGYGSGVYSPDWTFTNEIMCPYLDTPICQRNEYKSWICSVGTFSVERFVIYTLIPLNRLLRSL